ncbi:hypothetical protein R5R35_013048 [Gryllus longicercus]|uniref:Uncharacterized protein n=1 Tax=Gryllus longicercus TaxID=2509291 RepID=A0AAN9Z2J9_9ORTH
MDEEVFPISRSLFETILDEEMVIELDLIVERLQRKLRSRNQLSIETAIVAIDTIRDIGGHVNSMLNLLEGYESNPDFEDLYNRLCRYNNLLVLLQFTLSQFLHADHPFNN